MRNAKYTFYVVKLLKLPFKNCCEYVCVPQAWIAMGNKKGIFVRYPSKEMKTMRKLVRKRRKYDKSWKFHKAMLVFGADTYAEVKTCIENKMFNICQDFWNPAERTRHYTSAKWDAFSYSLKPTSRKITAPKSIADKPQMKVAPIRNNQNIAIKIPTRRFSLPSTSTHKEDVGKNLTTLSVESAEQVTDSNELIENMSENQLLSVNRNQTNKEPNRTLVQMSTTINDVIDKACPQNQNFNNINSVNQAIQSGPTLEDSTNQPNTLDHGSCLGQESHSQNFTTGETTASYRRVSSNSQMHSKLKPSIISNSAMSTNQSYQSFGHYNANQPLPHTDYLHSYPYTHDTLAGMSAVVNNIDQRGLPQMHVTNSTSYPSRECEYISSFWENARMRHNLRTHLLTRRHMEANVYQEMNSQNAPRNITSYSRATQTFQKPVQDRSVQPVIDQSSLALKDYLLVDLTTQKKDIKRTTRKNPTPLSTKDTIPFAPYPSNLINHNNRPSFQEHFSAIHRNYIFEDLPTQDLQNTKTVNSNQSTYLQSRQQDLTSLTDQNYSRPYIQQPRPPVDGYSNHKPRNPFSFNSGGVNHHQHFQRMPVSSTSIIPERNLMHTFPNFQDYYHSYLNKYSKINQIPPSDQNYNIQQNLRREAVFENSSDTINVNSHYHTQEIPISSNNSCCPCKCLQLSEDKAASNRKEHYLKQSVNSNNNTENTSQFSPVCVPNKTNATVVAEEPSNNSESCYKMRSTVIRKPSNSKIVSHDVRKTAEFKIITKQLKRYFKKIHLFSLRMLEMYLEEQITLSGQKELLEDLMKFITSIENNQ